MNETVERAGSTRTVPFQRLGGVCVVPCVRVLVPVCLLAIVGCGSSSKGSAVETHVEPPLLAEDGGVTPGTVDGGTPNVNAEPVSAPAEDGGVTPGTVNGGSPDVNAEPVSAPAEDGGVTPGNPGANLEPADVPPEDAGGSPPLDGSPDTPTAPGGAQPAIQYGTANNDWVYAVCTTESGELLIAGSTEGALEGNTIGERDAYLRKLDAQGVILWTTVWGEEGGMTSASHCATTEAGNTHIVGSLGGETVLSIFDPEGQLISRETIELPEYESIAGAAPLPNGGVVLISGHAVGASSISVESYDSEGRLVEHWALDSGGEDFAEAVATNAEGSIFVGGATEGPFGDDEAEHSLPGLSPIAFVRKYDIRGEVQWTRYLGTAMYDRVLSLTTDDEGNVYFAGRTSGDLLEFENAGNDDVFVGAYSAEGTLLWLHQQGGELFDWPSSIAVHPDGTVYVGGSSGMSDPDGSQYTGMVWIYDSEGSPIDTLEFEEGESTNVREVVVTPQGAVYIAGTTNGALEGNASQGAVDSFYKRIR